LATDIHHRISALLKTYGPHIYEDKRRLIALLKDVLARESRSWQVKLLILSVDDGVLERLLKQLGSMPPPLLLENHARGFSEGFQINPDAARWVIETWLYCFEPYQSEVQARRPRRAYKPPPVSGQISRSDEATLARLKAPPLPQLPQEREHTFSEDAAEFTNVLGMKFIRINAGFFDMGSPENEAERDSAEVLHRIYISKTFYLQNTPVTQTQWQQILGKNPAHFQGADHPVEKVTWKDCEDFVTRLNTGGQFHYRLPTEAEWEYAARAGAQSAYFFGQNAHDLTDYAWIKANSELSTQPVMQKKPNPWGLYDMYGNVREYCQDWYGPYQPRQEQDPDGPAKGTYKICRGGSWKFMPAHCRSASRHLMRPGVAVSDIGLRLVLTL